MIEPDKDWVILKPTQSHIPNKEDIKVMVYMKLKF